MTTTQRSFLDENKRGTRVSSFSPSWRILRGTNVVLGALLLWGCLSTSIQGEILKSADPRQFFMKPAEDSVLRWASDETTSQEDVPCQISGYDGSLVTELEGKRESGNVVVSVNLPEGFYTISFPQQNQVFGLFVQPPFLGKRDPFFGMDSSLSWLGSQELRAALVDVMRRLGISIDRERLRWKQIEPSPDVWDWESPANYEQMRQLDAGAGIQVLELFQATPEWMQTDKKNSVFPQNLPVTEESWRTIGQRWSPYWGGIEVWNEPDIIAGRGGPGAERYVPLIKTIKYALQSANLPTPVGGGVFAYFTKPYMDLAAKNGMLQVIDFLSFHYYKDPFQLESMIGEYRRYLKQFGRESLPIWITESGTPSKGVPHARPEMGIDQTTALKYAELAVEAKACGVSRIFPFVLVDYSEHGTNTFGMLDRAGSPLRSLTAYAQAVRALSGAEYMGDVDLGDQEVRSRVFRDAEGKAIIVIQAPPAGKKTVSLTFLCSTIQGIDGRKLEVQNDQLSLVDGIAYVRTEMNSIQGILNGKTTAMELHQIGEASPEPVVASPVVLEATLDAKTYPYGVRGYEIPKGTTSLSVSVRVNNLSSTTQNISLKLQAGSSATSVSGETSVEDISVPAESFRNVTAVLDASSIQYDAGGAAYLRVQGQGQEAGRILPAVLQVSTPLGMDEYLKAYGYHFALPIGDLNRWRKNSSGDMEFSKSDGGNFQYSVSFTASDHWAYPRFALPQEVDLDRITGVLIRGRCAKPATVRIMTWPGNDNNYSTTGYSVFPADGQWHVAYIPLSDFISPHANESLGRQVQDISVGLGSSKGDENNVEVSDLILLGDAVAPSP